jgi:hypothetical protein
MEELELALESQSESMGTDCRGGIPAPYIGERSGRETML